MANVSAYAGKAMLDWSLLGATPTQPPAIWLGVAKSAPSSTNGQETSWPANQGNSRATITFSTATLAGQTATNSLACTFGTMSALTTIRGWSLWDTGNAINTGNMLWFGTLTTARTCSSGDTLVFAAGSLAISLS
jgi:hypothetical protein